MEDDFQSINTDLWDYEIQRGGFGSGTFEWTTKDSRNAYTDAEGLHIVPTLTMDDTGLSKDQMTDNYVLNMTTDGTCTTKGINECSIRSNKTSGDIINPVRSARLTTKGKKSITFGKVEVVAKMPQGDWLWPAIWMMVSSIFSLMLHHANLKSLKEIPTASGHAPERLTLQRAEATTATTTLAADETLSSAPYIGVRYLKWMLSTKQVANIRPVVPTTQHSSTRLV